MAVAFEPFDPERERLRLRTLSDEELIKEGKAARYMCAPATNFGKPPREEIHDWSEALEPLGGRWVITSPFYSRGCSDGGWKRPGAGTRAAMWSFLLVGKLMLVSLSSGESYASRNLSNARAGAATEVP
jgi:hypothetical protein